MEGGTRLYHKHSKLLLTPTIHTHTTTHPPTHTHTHTHTTTHPPTHTHTHTQELIGKYILLENYFMLESLRKAVEIDSCSEDGLTSSMADDIFFVLQKCTR